MAEPEVHELVIIKHRRDHDEEVHHGGVWKIAYADFMTAMMAFFLVLWLLNSTNKEARISILNYFNPIKLADASMTRKGIQDQKKSQPAGAPDETKPRTENSKGDKTGDLALYAPSKASDDKIPLPANELKQTERGDASVPSSNSATPSSAPAASASAQGKEQEGAQTAEIKSGTYSEGALFKDPYRILGEIAGLAPTPAMPQPGNAPPADQPSTNIGQGGDAAANYRDPFESVQPKLALQTPSLPPDAPPATRPPKSDVPKAEAPKVDASKTDAPKADAAKADQPKADIAKFDTAKPEDLLSQQAAAAASAPAPSPGKQAQGKTQDDMIAVTPAEVGKLKAEIAKALTDVMGGQASPKIDVQVTSEGVLISLTDGFDFGMFAIGSAEPQPKLVKLMEKVAQLLKSRAGPIVIRGHTDGRAYKTQAYDNWHLSSDRAQMARYMLVRGGLDEKRFEAVEGYADRRLKLPSDPTAAENRRIEILLRKEPG